MKFKLPGNPNITVRLFEPVETVDSQYDIVDTGLVYTDGGIDSIAVGGSFHSLKSALSTEDTAPTAEQVRKHEEAVNKQRKELAAFALSEEGKQFEQDLDMSEKLGMPYHDFIDAKKAVTTPEASTEDVAILSLAV